MKKDSFISLLPRTIKANMRERYIFNFKIKPDKLAAKLPVPWLEPQIINDWSVVSFCILWLEKISLSPIPPIIPFHTISCAYRIGVIDTSGAKPEPSVYITDRYADLPIIAKLSPWIMLDTIPIVKAAVGHTGENTFVQMSLPNEEHLFSADISPASNGFHSDKFNSVDDFAEFIKKGVTSYAPSIFPDKYAKVDLKKEDKLYEPLNANIEHSGLSISWADAGMVFDSAVRATGALYQWTYRGLWTS